MCIVLVLCICNRCFAENDSPANSEQKPEEEKKEEIPLSGSNESSNDDVTVEEDNKTSEKSQDEEKSEEYGTGSLCVYCKYCKVCNRHASQHDPGVESETTRDPGYITYLCLSDGDLPLRFLHAYPFIIPNFSNRYPT